MKTRHYEVFQRLLGEATKQELSLVDELLAQTITNADAWDVLTH